MVNLIANSGFEQDPITVEQDGFWFLNIWGTGTVVPAQPFSIETADVYEGARAIRCHVESILEGYFQFVVGSFKVSATALVPGQEFQLRLAYKSTVPLTLTVQGSLAGTSNLSQSIDLPASTVWTLSPWLTFTIPTEGLDWFQFYVLSNNQIGDYLVDAFELTSTVAPITHIVTLDSSPTGVAYTSPIGVAPFTVNVDDGTSLAVQVPSEIEV